MNRAERRRLAKQKNKAGAPASGGNTDQLFQSALTHHQQGQLEQAIKGYLQVIRIDPNLPNAHYNLGTIYLDQGHLDDAEKAFRRTIEIDPNFAGGYFNLGFILSEKGQLDDARSAFRKVITLVPDAADAHRQLASITKHSEIDKDVQAMEHLFIKPGLTDAQRMDLSFGLAKAYEDLTDYHKSFEHLQRGNTLKRQGYAYSTDEQKTYFASIIESWSSSTFENFTGAGYQGNPDEIPIFILGMPRSGTTLVEQILASHPNVHGAGELPNLSSIASNAFGSVSDHGYGKNVSAADQKQFADIGGAYIQSLRALSENSRFITDKMPHNFLHIGLIKLALPNAKIIHCKRSPMDNCLSIYKTYFPGNVHEYSCDLTELGEYYLMYQDLMEHWHKTLPGCIYDIQYEELVADQETQSRALIDHCGLDWNDACLEFYKTKRAVRTASVTQVRIPIYNSSIALWKRYEEELAPLLATLNN
jgi:tetratricopeptide (TPR) repeat protein